MANLLEKLIIIQSKLIAPKGQYNSFGKYKYRSCEDILESLKPLLKEQGVAITFNDEIVQIGDRYYVQTTLKIMDGESSITTKAQARESEIKKGMDESQITGAASSYARKYALNGLFCIDDTKDSDVTNKQEENQLRELFNNVIDIQKTKFKSAEERKEWFVKHEITKAVKEMNEPELTKLTELLKND